MRIDHFVGSHGFRTNLHESPACAPENSEVWSSFFKGDTGLLRKAVEENRFSNHGLETLIQSLVEIDRQSENNLGHTALTWFCEIGDEEMVSLLLENGADVSAPSRGGKTPLDWATDCKHPNIVEILRQSQMNFPEPPSSTLTVHKAWSDFFRGDASTLSRKLAEIRRSGGDLEDLLLAKHEIDRKSDHNLGHTALTWFCEIGDEEMVSLLLKNGADANAVGCNDWTPLLWATVNDNLSIIQLLLNRGAKVDAQASDGRTSLHRVCRRPRTKKIALLLKWGAKPDIADRRGWTPLLWVCHRGKPEIARQLLENGASVDFADSEGRTPLFWACRSGCMENVALLLEHGADASIADSRGVTPLDEARRKRYAEIVRLLEESAAEVGKS